MLPAAEDACAATYLRRMATPLLLPVISVFSKFPIMCADGGHNSPRPWPLDARATEPYLNVLAPGRNSGYQITRAGCMFRSHRENQHWTRCFGQQYFDD